MDESRKAFERFLREEHLYTDEELAWEDDRNCYSIYPVHIAWKCWQASREEIELKAPESISTREALDAGYSGDYAAGRDGGLDDWERNIRAAGIKVKE